MDPEALKHYHEWSDESLSFISVLKRNLGVHFKPFKGMIPPRDRRKFRSQSRFKFRCWDGKEILVPVGVAIKIPFAAKAMRAVKVGSRHVNEVINLPKAAGSKVQVSLVSQVPIPNCPRFNLYCTNFLISIALRFLLIDFTLLLHR